MFAALDVGAAALGVDVLADSRLVQADEAMIRGGHSRETVGVIEARFAEMTAEVREKVGQMYCAFSGARAAKRGGLDACFAMAQPALRFAERLVCAGLLQ